MKPVLPLTMPLLMVLLSTVSCSAQDWTAKQALTLDSRTQVQLLPNGDLERVQEKTFEGWRPWQLGYEVDDQVKHGGRYSAKCTSASNDEQRGMTYVLTLNQQTPAPIMAELWSKADQVTGGQDSNYSLYLDLEYMDGTPLWGQTSPFKAGTHDWQKRTVVVTPAKPIKSVSVHGIFRGRTGTAWFDDFRFWEVRVPGGVQQFDGVTIASSQPPTGAGTPGIPVRLFCRDVAAKSSFLGPEQTWSAPVGGVSTLSRTIEGLKLSLAATWKSIGRDAYRLDLTVKDLSGADRALTVYCSVPVEALFWTWYDDQRSPRPIEEGGKYSNYTSVRAGANGMASRWPFACIAGRTEAMVIGAPLDVPRLCRFSYDAGSRELFAAVDVGLSAATRRFPSQATMSFVVYRSEPRWGFRSALQRYYELFPDCFTKRNTKEGIWMPFDDIAKVQGFEDFGFQFHEGNNNVPFDDQNGIDSFVYVEPASHWLSMPKDMERTNDRAIAYLKEKASKGDLQSQATLSSALEDPEGAWYGGTITAPWCDGALYYNNPSPFVKPLDPAGVTQFDVRWRSIDGAFKRAESAPQKAVLDGTYVDSFEMAATQLNYRPSHLAETGTPLVYDTDGRLCQMEIFNSLDFVSELAHRMWGAGKMTFANSTPANFPWGGAWFDVMGTETNWCPGGKYTPNTDATMNYRRGICYQRPYLLLMNTVFDDMKPEWIELYMKRCVAYAIFPGFFSHNASSDTYFTRPLLYNRDRPLFRKYIPVIKTLSAAGWQPITWAWPKEAKVYLERYGDGAGPVYLTVFNDSSQAVSTEMSIDLAALGRPLRAGTVRELFSGSDLAYEVNDKYARLPISLGPEDVKVLLLGP